MSQLTITDKAAHDLTLGAMGAQPGATTCVTQGCGHFYAFNVDNLIASAGEDYLVPEIIPGIVCTACGGALEFKLAMVPPEG